MPALNNKEATLSAAQLIRMRGARALSTDDVNALSLLGAARWRGAVVWGVAVSHDVGASVPGFLEADLVSHGGENVAGSFALTLTLTLTDIASRWTECVALAVKEGALIVEALTRPSAAA